MNNDHGSVRPSGGGCEAGGGQPNVPAPRYVPATPKSPPKKTESGQKQSPGEQISPERTKSPVKPADDPVEASLNATPAQISPTAKRLDGPPESFANVVSIVERSAMPEQDRLEIYLGILHQMSPTLHGFAAAAGWDSSRVAKLLTTGSGIFPPPVHLGASGRHGSWLLALRGALQ